jgi:NhaP-type Na+/H+ or K+/H+ antiporter
VLIYSSSQQISCLDITDILDVVMSALGTIFSATDSVCTLQVLSQDDTPLLYSLVFGEGVVNDATSVVLFRAVQKLTFDDFTGLEVLQMTGSFLYLFFSSTVLGIMVSLLLQLLWMLFVQTDLPI